MTSISPVPSDPVRPVTGAADDPPAQGRRSRHASVAGLVGTLVEYYDFSIYAFLAVFFAPLFFPADDPATSALSALAVFGSAYVVRPLGGIVFGRLGDRRGRRTALMATVVLMGTASTLLGLLPTYATLGVLAPVLLVALRLLQGFSAGGELMGAVTLVAESSSARRRALFGSLTPAGSSLGFAVATGVVGALAFLLGPEAMAQWGWRIPFLLCLPLTLACLLVRLRLEDSPEFRRAAARQQLVRRPVLEVLAGHRRALLVVLALAFSGTVVGYVGLTYVGGFLQRTHGLSTATSSTLAAVVIALSCVTAMPTAGLLTDRFGRRQVCIVATVALGLLTLPLFLVMQSVANLVVIGLAFYVFMALNALQVVPSFTLFAELFPASVRYSGTALGHNLAVIVGGGFTPFVAAQLVVWTGSPLAPTLWVTVAAVLGVVAVLAARPVGIDGADPVP